MKKFYILVAFSYLILIIDILIVVFANIEKYESVANIFGYCFYIVSLILILYSFIISIYSLITIKKENNKITYKKIMILKLLLIPFFITNFIISLIAGLFLMLPYTLFIGIFIIPLMILFTYIIMLPLSIASTSISLRKIKEENNTNISIILILQILEYFFIIDVISSIFFYIKFEE